MGTTRDKLGHIGQAFPDLVRLQLKGHGAIIMNSTQRFKQSLEINHPFAGWQMKIVLVRASSAVIMEMNMFNSLRELFDEAQAPVLLTKKLSMAQIKGHHQARDLMESQFQIASLLTQVLDADCDFMFSGLFHDPLEKVQL